MSEFLKQVIIGMWAIYVTVMSVIVLFTEVDSIVDAMMLFFAWGLMMALPLIFEER